jgi:putative ABC transport system substrate-binding protein
MKKFISLILAALMLSFASAALSSCNNTGVIIDTSKDSFVVGICQLMKHESLDSATQGFIDALTEKMAAAGKSVTFDTQIPGEANLCPTVINTFVSKNVDLIMANATPSLLAAANATANIPILGTSVTDYEDTFAGIIPENDSGTSDAVPFDEQARMMIDTLDLSSGDRVGIIYCTNESNSLIQYKAVKELFESNGIIAEAYTFSETSELQAITEKAAGECKAIYVPSDNTVANHDTVVGTVCEAKRIPVFTSYGGSICYASLAIDYYQLGYETGVMAADVLLGNKTFDQLTVATLTPAVKYNDELCAQLGIAVPKE